MEADQNTNRELSLTRILSILSLWFILASIIYFAVARREYRLRLEKLFSAEVEFHNRRLFETGSDGE